VSENGMGKRSDIDDYRLIGRGGRGVKTMNVTDKTGAVVGVLQVTSDADEVVLVTNEGKLIRIGMSHVASQGRNTQGVRLVRLDTADGELVVAVAPVAESEADVDADGTEDLEAGNGSAVDDALDGGGDPED
jgi:DNA gyrase subunit A